MSDETDPKQAMEERKATSEGRAEVGPLTGIQDAANGRNPDGTTGGIGTGDGTNGAGTAKGNTAAPPNR